MMYFRAAPFVVMLPMIDLCFAALLNLIKWSERGSNVRDNFEQIDSVPLNRVFNIGVKEKMCKNLLLHTLTVAKSKTDKKLMEEEHMPGFYDAYK